MIFFSSVCVWDYKKKEWTILIMPCGKRRWKIFNS